MWFQKKSCQVICIGSASKDIFFPTDEAVLIDTPDDITSKQKIAFELGGKYRVKDRYEAVGGVAANVSQGLSRLGLEVGCYSTVGDDEIGKWIAEELHKENVFTSFVTFDEDAKTDLSAIIVMTQNGERTIFHNRDANEKLVVKQERLEDTAWLFVSALNGEWRDNLETILDAKKKYNHKLALNPGQHNIKEDSTRILAAIRETDVLLLNKDEAIELLLKSYVKASNQEMDNELFLLEKLHEAGAKVIGMTDGKRGAWASNGNECYHSPMYMKGGLVDTTGAGDAFGSGFFACYMKTGSVKEALRYGIANGGSVVGFYGASAGLLHSHEMDHVIAHIEPKKLK